MSSSLVYYMALATWWCEKQNLTQLFNFNILCSVKANTLPYPTISSSSRRLFARLNSEVISTTLFLKNDGQKPDLLRSPSLLGVGGGQARVPLSLTWWYIGGAYHSCIFKTFSECDAVSPLGAPKIRKNALIRQNTSTTLNPIFPEPPDRIPQILTVDRSWNCLHAWNFRNKSHKEFIRVLWK